MSFVFSGQRITSLALEPVISANIVKPSAISGPVEGILFNDATQKSIGKMIGGMGVYGCEVVNINVTPVTGPSNTTTETSMMSYTFPAGPGWIGENAGALNAVGKTIHVFASGLANTTTAASTLVLKIRLGGATGAPPTGTTVATFSIPTTSATLTGAIWVLDAYMTIQAINASGGTGVVECHGWAGTPLATAAGAMTIVPDANTTTVTVGDLTTSQLFLISATQGTGGAANSVTQRQMVLQVLQ